MAKPGNVLRGEGHEAERVSYVELFFDLVFAFAVTQVSGVLGEEPSLLSILEAVVITLALWWVWVYTAWATNWLNPDRRPVLWLLLILTGASLIVSQAIPDAFGERAAVFVAAYLTYSLIRTVGVILATRKHAPRIAAGQYRILAWTSVSAVAWVAGANVEDPWLRLGLWGAAIGFEYLGPASLFWVPGRGRSDWSSWRVRGGHFSERAALFVIIVLGESILVVGGGLAEHEPTPGVALAAISAFANAVLMWFLYFAHGQERGNRFINSHEATGPVARVSYTYLHVVIVIGLVLSSHGSELALAHPNEDADGWFSILVLGGTAIYIAGLLAFKTSIGIPRNWIPSHVIGLAVFTLGTVALAAGWLDLQRLSVAWISTGILVLVVVGDEILWIQRARSQTTKVSG